MALWSRLTGIIAGIGISRAAGVVLEPALEPKRQDAWLQSLAAIPDPTVLARLVAQGLCTEAQAAPFAARNGFDGNKFGALVQLELRAASFDEILRLWQRDKALEPLVDHALAKAQVEEQYWGPLKELYTTRIPADLLAFAHQRGIIDNPVVPELGERLIPVSAPTTEAVDIAGEPSPIRQGQIPLDVLKEFQATGWDGIRAAVNARARGLPPAPGELLSLVNRGTISVSEYYAGIGEGDTRNEWRDYLLTLRRRLLTGHEYAEAYVRGWLPNLQAVYDGAALSGYEQQDADLLYKISGRPISLLRITQAEARGGHFAPLPGETTDPYRASMEQSITRPEWYPLLDALHYEYPGAFIVRTLLKEGAIKPEDAQDGTPGGLNLLLGIGWRPDLAKLVADYYGAQGKTTDPHVKSSITSAITTLRKDVTTGKIPAASAATTLAALGVAKPVADELLAVWATTAAIGAPTGPPPPLPTDVEIENLIAEGYSVVLPPLPPNAIADALTANGYTVTPPPPKPFQPTVAPPQGG